MKKGLLLCMAAALAFGWVGSRWRLNFGQSGGGRPIDDPGALADQRSVSGSSVATKVERILPGEVLLWRESAAVEDSCWLTEQGAGASASSRRLESLDGYSLELTFPNDWEWPRSFAKCRLERLEGTFRSPADYWGLFGSFHFDEINGLQVAHIRMFGLPTAVGIGQNLLLEEYTVPLAMRPVSIPSDKEASKQVRSLQWIDGQGRPHLWKGMSGADWGANGVWALTGEGGEIRSSLQWVGGALSGALVWMEGGMIREAISLVNWERVGINIKVFGGGSSHSFILCGAHSRSMDLQLMALNAAGNVQYLAEANGLDGGGLVWIRDGGEGAAGYEPGSLDVRSVASLFSLQKSYGTQDPAD